MIVLLALAIARAILTFGVPSAIDVPVLTPTEVVVIVETADCPMKRDASGEFIDDPCYAYATLEVGGALIIETGP